MSDVSGIAEEEEMDEAEDSDSSAFEESLELLKARCKAADIPFERDSFEEEEIFAQISIRAGKHTRDILIFSRRSAELILSTEFEKFSFVQGYDAIWAPTEGYIEAGLRTTTVSAAGIWRRLGLTPSGDINNFETIELTPPTSISGHPTLRLGPASPEFSALLSQHRPQMTLKLIGARATQNDHALQELRSYADSLFLQLDMLHGATFILERERRSRLLSMARRASRGTSLEYPKAQYNDDAMSLYWYAKTARDMPLLRFLAFYQAIEFYFPRYSQAESRKRVGAIIRSPTFRTHRDDDLDRLISAISSSRSGTIGSEKAQLRAVVSECISAEEMRTYLSENKTREDHFSGKSARPRYHKIPLANKTADLRNDVADRIYSIRCKIVHTKNDGSEDDISMILPFSDDADYLMPDIDLVQFMANCVLIASSGELS